MEIRPAQGEGSESEPPHLEAEEVLEGGAEVPGLRLELGEIWNA